MIRITSKQDGFRRCGIAHPATATEYQDGHFSAFALEVLKREPMLIVEILPNDPGGGKGPNVQQSVELVNSAATIEDLDKLAEGETRKGVLDAIEKRRAALTTPE